MQGVHTYIYLLDGGVPLKIFGRQVKRQDILKHCSDNTGGLEMMTLFP